MFFCCVENARQSKQKSLKSLNDWLSDHWWASSTHWDCQYCQWTLSLTRLPTWFSQLFSMRHFKSLTFLSTSSRGQRPKKNNKTAPSYVKAIWRTRTRDADCCVTWLGLHDNSTSTQTMRKAAPFQTRPDWSGQSWWSSSNTQDCRGLTKPAFLWLSLKKLLGSLSSSQPAPSVAPPCNSLLPLASRSLLQLARGKDEPSLWRWGGSDTTTSTKPAEASSHVGSRAKLERLVSA